MNGSWLMAQGSWIMAHGSRVMAYGSWPKGACPAPESWGRAGFGPGTGTGARPRAGGAGLAPWPGAMSHEPLVID